MEKQHIMQQIEIFLLFCSNSLLDCGYSCVSAAIECYLFLHLDHGQLKLSWVAQRS